MNEGNDWDNCYSKWVGSKDFVNRKLAVKDRWHKLIRHMLNQAKLDLSLMRIIEVGCGFGGFCTWLTQNAREVTGVDITPVGLKLGQSLNHQFRFGTDFILASGCRLPIQKASYDMSICTETLEHVPNYTQAFDEMIRITKPNGYIIITVPNFLNITYYDLLYKLKIKLTGVHSNQPDDINHFTVYTLIELAETRKLKTIIQQGTGLLQLPSNRHIAKKIQEHLDQPLNALKGLSFNIGILAQKRQ